MANAIAAYDTAEGEIYPQDYKELMVPKIMAHLKEFMAQLLEKKANAFYADLRERRLDFRP